MFRLCAGFKVSDHDKVLVAKDGLSGRLWRTPYSQGAPWGWQVWSGSRLGDLQTWSQVCTGQEPGNDDPTLGHLEGGGGIDHGDDREGGHGRAGLRA